MGQSAPKTSPFTGTPCPATETSVRPCCIIKNSPSLSPSAHPHLLQPREPLSALLPPLILGSSLPCCMRGRSVGVGWGSPLPVYPCTPQAPRGLHDSLAMNAARSGYRVFSANSTAASTELAKKITERLGAELGKSVVYQETNGETRVEIKESVRGQDIFIIQTIPRDVNTAVMELLIMAYALKTSCARNIIGVIPYFPYSKQSKMRKRGSIVCKLLASMLAKAGLTHIITMDLHQKEIQGFFSFPVDNLRASPFLLQYIQEEVSDDGQGETANNCGWRRWRKNCHHCG
ncbi:phosphoribosyl pyrophosphate synthase-associated protein 1 isoform 6-T11 [Sylvia borin]